MHNKQDSFFGQKIANILRADCAIGEGVMVHTKAHSHAAAALLSRGFRFLVRGKVAD